jgi:UMP-CMP kinase
VDQAQYFEQNVIETQQVLYYEVPQEVMLERCLKRGETSGRTDDNVETIKKRVQNYFDQTYPVIEYYKKFGKVRKIDATGSISEVYAQTKEAILPQTMMILGPKASGKSMIATNLA